MVSAPTLRFAGDLEEALSRIELATEVTEALAEAGDHLINATIEEIAEIKGVSLAGANGIHAIIARFKSGVALEDEVHSSAIPDGPPYLPRDADGNVFGYDPHDASQFWQDEENPKIAYRWDGQRFESARNEAGDAIGRFPQGEPHRVVQIPHDPVPVGSGMVRVPIRRELWTEEAKELTAAGAHWFHHGYNCWIGRGNKPLAEVPQSIRTQVVTAQTQRDGTRAQF